MSLVNRLKPFNTPLTLAASVLLVAVLTQLIGVSLLVRIVTVMFVSMILVLGLQLFMGNSGILSLAHMGLWGMGAYPGVLFSMTPAAKELPTASRYPF